MTLKKERQHFGDKFEARNTKFETNSNNKMKK
jgi:hypothetical protein